MINRKLSSKIITGLFAVMVGVADLMGNKSVGYYGVWSPDSI